MDVAAGRPGSGAAGGASLDPRVPLAGPELRCWQAMGRQNLRGPWAGAVESKARPLGQLWRKERGAGGMHGRSAVSRDQKKGEGGLQQPLPARREEWPEVGTCASAAAPLTPDPRHADGARRNSFSSASQFDPEQRKMCRKAKQTGVPKKRAAEPKPRATSGEAAAARPHARRRAATPPTRASTTDVIRPTASGARQSPKG